MDDASVCEKPTGFGAELAEPMATFPTLESFVSKFLE
jgi:hypothetical protein